MLKTRYKKFSFTLVQSFAFYSAIAILLLTLFPYNFQPNINSSFSWLYSPSEVLNNLALTWPLGFFLVLVRKKYLSSHFIVDITAGLLLSLLIETGQLFLEERTSQYGDVICNSLGVFLGIVVGTIIKPTFNRQLEKTTNSMLSILGLLCLLSILIFIRLISDRQSFALFEILLLFCGSILIALAFNHYAYNSRKSVVFQSNITSIIYVLIVGSPLLFSDTSTLLSTSLVVGFFTPMMTIRTERASYTAYKIKRNLLTLTAIVLMTILFFMAWIHLNSSQSQLQFLSYVYGSHSSSHKVVGGIIAETILPYIMLMQLINYLHCYSKKSIQLKTFIYTILLTLITGISFPNIINYSSNPTPSFVYLTILLLTFILFFSQARKPNNLE